MSSQTAERQRSAQPSQAIPLSGFVLRRSTLLPNQSTRPASADAVPQSFATSFHSPEHIPKFSRRDADLEPWRYRGYPAMSKWMASDDDFFIVRRFGELSARVLLRLQDRIVKLEEDLERMDQMCMENGSNNGTFRYDPSDERQRLLDELTARLEQYQRFLLDHAQLKARPEATDFQISNVKQWFKNANEKVIQHEEQQFINKEGDLMPLLTKTKTPLRRFIDRFETPRLWALFRDRDINQRLHGSSGDFGLDTTVYYKEPESDIPVILVTLVLVLAMLLELAMLPRPPGWLQQLSSQYPEELLLGIICLLMIAWTIVLTMLAMSWPLKVLVATGGCGAVLVTFLQNTT